MMSKRKALKRGKIMGKVTVLCVEGISGVFHLTPNARRSCLACKRGERNAANKDKDKRESHET
jgi:hypothetical protein